MADPNAPDPGNQNQNPPLTPAVMGSDVNAINPTAENVSQPSQPSLPPQPAQKKSFAKLIFLIVTAFVLGASAFLFLKLRKPKVAINQQISPTQAPTEIPAKTATLYTNTKYYYDLLIPPAYNQEFIPDEVTHEERVVRFVKKQEGSNTSKIEVYMTSSKELQNTIAGLTKRLEKYDANQPLKDGSSSYSKIHISNFIAYQTEFEDESGYKNTLLVEKDKWIYQIILETNGKNEINTLREFVTKINIYDSEAKFYID